MTEAALQRLDAGSLFIAALRGWVAGVLAGLAVFALYTLSTAPLSPVTIGDLLWGIPNALLAFAIIGAIGGIVSLPGPILSIVLLWLAERISRRTRNLPFWLGVGLVASLPSAVYAWNIILGDPAWESATGQPRPHTWDSLQLPLLVLACGLVAASVGWRTQARLAK